MGLPLGKKGWTDREITRTPGPSLVDCWPSEARAGQFTQFTLPTIVKQAYQPRELQLGFRFAF